MIGILLLILSVLFGGGVVVFLQRFNQQRMMKIFLALSGGFLLAIAFIHFIPEIYLNQSIHVGYYILLGFLIQLVLEYFSGGIEHGHLHSHNKSGQGVSLTLFVALSVHAFLEGMPLEHLLDMEVLFSSHFLANYSLLIGICLHKIPVAIALMTLLLAGGQSKKKAWLFLFLFSLMAPIGMMLGKVGAVNSLINLDMILAVVVGMFLHISTTIIFESSENHRFNFIKLISIIAGVGLAIVTM